MSQQKEIDKYINLAVIFDTFKFIPRLSTKRIPIQDKESVAIHIYEMIYLGYLSYYSMDIDHRKNLDLLKIIELILWHEADEAITNDIPYPAKKMLRETGNGNALDLIKDMVVKVFNKLIPSSLFVTNGDIINETFLGKESNEKRFVKFLDYVNLYLNSINLSNRGYNTRLTIEECKKLTSENEFYEICPLVKELMENPNNFVNKEYN